MEIIKPITKGTLLSQGSTEKISKEYLKNVQKKFDINLNKELDGVKFNTIDDKEIQISDYNRGMEDYDYENKLTPELKKRLQSYIKGKEGKDNINFTKKAERKNKIKRGNLELYGKMPLKTNDVEKNTIFENVKDYLKSLIGEKDEEINEDVDLDTITKVVDAVDKMSTSGTKPKVSLVKDKETNKPKIEIIKESLVNENIARKYIPNNLKFNGSVFSIVDDNNEYVFKWEKDGFINEGILIDYKNKKLIKENLNKTFRLISYDSPKNSLNWKELLNEDIYFREIYNKLNQE